jgi:hypothetical protein
MQDTGYFKKQFPVVGGTTLSLSISTTCAPQNIQGKYIQYGATTFIFVTYMCILGAQNSAVVFTIPEK